MRPVRVGISSCLLGEAVRFDGGHKRAAVLIEALGALVEWVPVCPEVECGLGTPREPIQLVRTGRDLRLVTVTTGVDVTRRMTQYARERIAQLESAQLSGYIFKKDSPSCGLEGVKVYDANGAATESGGGMFAAMLVERFPGLPVDDEGRLSDSLQREQFVERVLAYWRRTEGRS